MARRRSLRTAFGFLLSLALALVDHAGTVAAEPLVLDVASAAPAFDQRTGEPLVSFRLTEASRLVFADFTARNVGRKVDLRVDGRVMTSPVIREPITGGTGQIAGKLTAAQASDIATRLASGRSKLEIELALD